MGYSKILVGYDCSDASNRALADAYELVDHGLADGVVVVTVTDLAKTAIRRSTRLRVPQAFFSLPLAMKRKLFPT